jgi:hypothetical protein
MKHAPIHRIHHRLLGGCILIGVLGAGCSAPGSDAANSVEAGAPATSVAAPLPITIPSSTLPALAAAADQAPEPFATGLPLLTLLAPAGPVTERAPEFAWQAVEGTVTYRLAVVNDEGPIWSWDGAGTSVRLGGFSEDRPAGFPGPEIDSSARWSVVALDGDGTVLAASELRPLTTEGA